MEHVSKKIRTTIGNDLSLALPGSSNTSAPLRNDDLYSHMMQQFQVNVLDVCRKTLEDEVKKTKEVEMKLKEVQEEYKLYVDRTATMEDKLQRRVFVVRAKKAAGDGMEEVGANYNHNIKTCDVEILCKKCNSQMANMVFLPCRHLCVCVGCYDKVSVCPICGGARCTSFKVDVRVQSP